MNKETWKWLNDNKDIQPFKDVLRYISKLEDEIEQEKNKELNLENQALYESINCNDDNMLVRRYEKLQNNYDKLFQGYNERVQEILLKEKENEELREQLLNAVEIENKKVSKYWIDKIKGKIKELEELFDKNEKEITIQYQNQFIVDIVGVLEDLLKEN